MRILIHSINYHPELTGIGKYTGEMAEWLVKHGCDVRVVTAPPYYPAWQVAPTYRSWLYRCETLADVAIIRCPLWVPSAPTGLKRLLHLASFAYSALPVMLWQAWRWKPDLVFVVEPPLFCSFAALAAARLSGAKAWLHIQDFEVDAAFELQIIKNQRLRDKIESFERWLLGLFDTVSTISPRMLAKLTDKGVAQHRQVLFENWVNLQQIYPLPPAQSLRSELAIPADKVVVLYSGNMGKKQGLEIVVQAAQQLQHRHEILFILCGDGVERRQLAQSTAGMDNIRFLDLQPLAQLNALLNTADIHLLPQLPGAQDLVMPSKLTNILASGKPVIATAEPDSQVAQVASQAGLVVPPQHLSAFVAAIDTLAGDANKRHQLGACGREFACEKLDQNKWLQTVFADWL